MRVYEGAGDMCRNGLMGAFRLSTGDVRWAAGHGLGVEGIWVNHALVTCAIDKDILGIHGI